MKCRIETALPNHISRPDSDTDSLSATFVRPKVKGITQTAQGTCLKRVMLHNVFL